ncbi:hypothetical protein CVT24_009974 [Panaeolus cyanescens]|uniref:DUF6593 domain-containing protein n=1 Tax=Panaeolus cyanescens TaxID=181874 RepID=A0A409VXA6_9AGAR|nr:hypothetical protein CVT24_009974 [Panaeolus cyanescens]
MDLYFVPNDIEYTTLFSANGVPHYRIRTLVNNKGPRVTLILRPSQESSFDTLIAEIEWKDWDTPGIIRSPLFSGAGQEMGMAGVGLKAVRYLYKRHRFSPSRYFVGDDAIEYRWKMMKEHGCMLTQADTRAEVACSMNVLSSEGFFAGENKEVLRIQPCSVDIDLIILTFVMMEIKRRRKYGGTFVEEALHDEEPQGECDGGGSGEGEGDVGADVGEVSTMVGEL